LKFCLFRKDLVVSDSKSCVLLQYIHRPWLIVKHHQPNQSNLYLYTFCPSFSILFVFSSIRSLSRRHNLQSYHGSRLSSIQASLSWRRSTLSKPDGAPDCRRSQQNRTIQFLKPDSSILLFQVGAFGLCSFL
jgi:hypothetical protein